MARLDCDYYPGTAASWRCNTCNINYGDKCIPDGHGPHWGKRGPRCLRCEGQLQFLGSATDAKPFWQQLPQFFLYALHPNSLMVIAVVTVASLLVGPRLWALLVVLFAMAVVVKYGFAIIERYGQGDTTPPALTAVLSGDEHHLFLRQIAMLFGIGVAAGLAGHINAGLGMLVVVFFTLALPASMIVLAVEKSVRRSLNPFALLRLMTAIGWPYLLLWFCTQIISAGPTYVFAGLAAVLPEAAVVPLIAVLMTYFTFVLYAMLGYVLYEYQHELGFESKGEESAMEPAEFEKARALGAATVLMREGQLERARAALRRGLDLAKDDIELHLHYHKLLGLVDDPTALANHCNYLVELCDRKRCLNRAVPALLETLKQLPAFQLDDTQLTVEMARLLRLQGQHRAVVQLLEDLHQRRPNDSCIPAAYTLLANVLFEFYNQDQKAAELARYVLDHYPGCEERAGLERLLGVINPTAARA